MVFPSGFSGAFFGTRPCVRAFPPAASAAEETRISRWKDLYRSYRNECMSRDSRGPSQPGKHPLEMEWGVNKSERLFPTAKMSAFYLTAAADDEGKQLRSDNTHWHFQMKKEWRTDSGSLAIDEDGFPWMAAFLKVRLYLFIYIYI